MIVFSDHPEGLILSVRAQPAAKRSGIMGEHAGALKVAVRAPARDGRANEAVLEILREAFDLKRSQVQLLSGEASRDKRVLITDVSRPVLQARLVILLDRAGPTAGR
jgi:uncharacterized protein (TIGR00251 family)